MTKGLSVGGGTIVCGDKLTVDEAKAELRNFVVSTITETIESTPDNVRRSMLDTVEPFRESFIRLFGGQVANDLVRYYESLIDTEVVVTIAFIDGGT